MLGVNFILSAVGAGCTKTETYEVSPPEFHLACAKDKHEIMTDLALARGGEVVVPVARCFTPLVMLPHGGRRISQTSSNWIELQDQYQDGSLGEIEWDAPTMKTNTRKVVTARRFRNDGTRTNGKAVRLRIAARGQRWTHRRTVSASEQTILFLLVLLLVLGGIGIRFRKQLGEAAWKTIGVAAATSILFEQRKEGNAMRRQSAEPDSGGTPEEEDASEMKIQAGLRSVRGEYPDIPIPPLGSELHVYEGFFETFRDRVRMRAVAERADAMLRLEQQVLDQLEKYIEHARKFGELNRSAKRNKVKDARLEAEELELEIELEEARQKLEDLQRRKKSGSASRFDALREIIERYHQKCPPGTTRASFAEALDDVQREQFLDEVKQEYGDDWETDDGLRRFLKRNEFRMD